MRQATPKTPRRGGRRLSRLIAWSGYVAALPGGTAWSQEARPSDAAPSGEPVYVCPPCGCASDSKTFDKPGECPDCKMGLVRKGPARAPWNVAIVVFEGFELLDFAGPGEVFSAAMGPNGHDFQVFTVAGSSEEVESNRSVVMIKPEHTIDKCPKPDIVVVPGGGVGALTSDAKIMDWIKQRAADSEVVMSVCNGAFVLQKAGLLDGLEATTHHGAIEFFRRNAPNTRVVTDRRYVDNGRIITAAGVSAGIDAALHVVERILGPEAADNTARYMEYTRRREPDRRIP